MASSKLVPRWISALFLFGYVVVRILFDRQWRAMGEGASYIFEVLFVAGAAYVYRKRLRWNFDLLESWAIDLIPAFVAGFALLSLIERAAIPGPFDFDSPKLILLLLVVSPLLEELLFRMALWEPAQDLLVRPVPVLVATTTLFAIGHLMAFFAVPVAFKSFVLVQTLYVVLLGLATGYRRQKTGSFVAPVLMHFAFNLGFFLASRV